jgi:hypothetical protein
MKHMYVVGALLFAGSVVMPGCSDDDGGGPGSSIERPFEAPTSNNTSTYTVTDYQGNTQVVTGGGTDPRVIDGREFDGVTIGEPSVDGGGDIWLDWQPESDQLEMGAAELTAPQLDTEIIGIFDPPLAIDLAPPVGVEQTLTATGTIQIGTSSSPSEISVPLSYTLVEEDATVEANGTSVHGCSVFEGSATILGEDYSGTAVYHPAIGLVSGSIDWPPPNGVSATFNGVTDYGEVVNGYRTMQATDVLSPNDSLRLSSYDATDSFDADKNTHAQMLVEMRWADDEMARNTPLPNDVYANFGTVFGTFPTFPVTSPVSVFFPEESGEGFQYRVYYVDQAARNESENPIAYYAEAIHGGDISSPVRVTMRVRYKVVSP